MNNKFLIYKLNLLLLFLSVFFLGCEKKVSSFEINSNGGKVRTEFGAFSTINELHEFEYKGHIYISCNVKGGLALTHAGHCWCNK